MPSVNEQEVGKKPGSQCQSVHQERKTASVGEKNALLSVVSEQ